MIILLVWLIIPYFAYSDVMRLAALAVTAILTFNFFSFIDRKLFWIIVLFIIYTTVINTFYSDSSFVLRHLQLYIFLIIIYLSSYIIYLEHDDKTFLIKVILILNLIALTGTLIGLNLDSSAARILAKSSAEGMELTESGIGGYGTVYTNILIFPLVFLVRKIYISNKLIKLLCWFTILLIILVILKANYFIAIILLIFQILFLNFKGFSFFFKITSILLLIFFLLSFKNNVSFLIQSVYPYVQGTSLQRKFDDILSNINGGIADNNTIAGRTDRYERSIKLFFESPVVGVFSFNDVGKHAILLDVLAQFGVVLAGILIFILKRIPIFIKRSIGGQGAVYVLCFMITLFILGSINNYGLAMGTAFILLACTYRTNESRISNPANQLND